jgi:hypothetical protein
LNFLVSKFVIVNWREGRERSNNHQISKYYHFDIFSEILFSSVIFNKMFPRLTKKKDQRTFKEQSSRREILITHLQKKPHFNKENLRLEL